MAIPKEPRQIMINIMYLVLTALLALNVSAEIFNAFDMVDKGLKTANNSLDQSNSKLPDAIREGAKKRESLQTYADRIDDVRKVSSQGNAYIDEIVNNLIDEAGDQNGEVNEGDYIMIQNKRELKGKKNFDATTRIMVDGGKGTELKLKMLELRKEFLKYVDEEDREAVAASIPINIDEESWKNSPHKKAGWADFTFGHMPLGATMPIFTKFKNDIKASESAVLNYLANKVGTNTDVVLDKFTVVSAPEKSYIIKGEKYSADIFLSAFAGADSKTGISIKVNGRNVPVNDEGIAEFTQTASSVGIKKYTATASITNPTTGETKTYSKEFSYEVGERGVSVSADKMNVFYIGVDNPVSVTAAGVPSEKVQVSASGAGGLTITPKGGGAYNVKASKPTKSGEFAYINVTAPGLNAKKEFRVKRIPNPVALFGGKKGGIMDPGTFRIQLGVGAKLENFDFDAKCNIQGFRMIYVPKREDAIPVTNSGARFGPDVLKYVKRAKPGDTYNFIDVKAKCPGDIAAREINSLVFNIQ